MAEGRRIRGVFTPLVVRLFVRNWRDRARSDVRLRIGIIAVSIALVANLIMFVLKLAAGLLIGSLALTADSIDNLGDVLMGVIGLVGFKVSAKGPDETHPYGHERAEEIAALVVAALLVFVGLQFGVESIKRFFQPLETEFSWFALGIAFASIFVKFGIARLSFNVGAYIDSPVLTGNAWNYLLDVMTSTLVVVALLGRYFGVYWLDPVMALCITALILHVAFGLFKDASDHLLGKGTNPTQLKEIERLVCSQPGVLGCTDVEMHWYGRKRRVSLRILVSDALNLRDAHDIAERVQDVLHGVHADWEPLVHVEPIRTQSPRGGHSLESLTE